MHCVGGILYKKQPSNVEIIEQEEQFGEVGNGERIDDDFVDEVSNGEPFYSNNADKRLLTQEEKDAIKLREKSELSNHVTVEFQNPVGKTQTKSNDVKSK